MLKSNLSSDSMSSLSSRDEPVEQQLPDQGGDVPGSPRPREFGGRKDGLDPTRYGDWEKNGRCIDF